MRFVEELFEVDLGTLDGRELAAHLQELERVARKVEHAIVDVVGHADRTKAWGEDGHRGVRGWCLATVNWSPAEAMHRVRSVALFDDVPEADDALAGGELGVAQVRELARARANPRCGDQLADVAEIVVEHAKSLRFDDFRRVVQRWEQLADTEGAHRDHERSDAARNASLHLSDDGFALDARGGVVQGAEMREIFERFCEAEFQFDWDTARGVHGDDTTAAHLARSAAQRRFDALHAIFQTAASTPPGSRPPEPVVDIVVDQATFETALARMAGDDSHGSDLFGGIGGFTPPTPKPDPAEWRCETIDGVPVDPAAAVAAALVGHVRRVVVDAESRVIDLGTTSRLFRGASRLAVWLQDARCMWPGCALRYCQVDHTQPYSEGGPTNAANGGPLCGRHNRWKTRGYRTWRDELGRWHLQRPDGTEITPI